MSSYTQMPNYAQETELWADGYLRVAGIDEVGRGALAGPVMAAAVIVPQESSAAPVWQEVRDSKCLQPNQRNKLNKQIQVAALAYGIGVISPAEIDRTNIVIATRQAMCAAVTAIEPAPDFLLIDWVQLPQLRIAQKSLPKADAHIISVAAASILAKVHRDTLMIELGEHYPDYGFAQHKGYGTAAHLAAIERYGPCPIHRQSFAPIARQATLRDSGAYNNRS